MAKRTVADRFWAKVEKSPDSDGCWLWTAQLDIDGYGRFSVEGHTRRAHRAAYELLVGPIPDGDTIDHDCHTRDASCAGGRSCSHRRCVRPDHLRPMGDAENILLGRGPCALNALKTHCKWGHELTPDNIRVRVSRKGKNGRECLTCHREWHRRNADRLVVSQ